MGEEAAGATQVSVNFDIAALNSKLDELIKFLGDDSNALTRDIAIKLFVNTNFDVSGKSPYQVAQDAIGKAKILVSSLKKEKLIK